MVSATALFSDGESAAAEQLIRAFLLRHGHHVEAMRLLARIGIERDVLDDAQLLLEAVLDLAPDYHAARYDYAQVLIERHMYPQAQEQAAKLLAVEPANRNYRTLYALTCVGPRPARARHRDLPRAADRRRTARLSCTCRSLTR